MATLDKPKIRARYAVKGPKKENVTYTKARIDENGALQMDPVTEEMDCYMIYFPHGHSIRVTSYEKLKELGYHVKPRMIDMNTGDILDIGGDPYDFANMTDIDEVVLEEEEAPPIKRKQDKE